jgi:hypothetical protein
VHVGLLLDTARVGQADRSGAEKRGEVEVAERAGEDRGGACAGIQPRRPKRRGSARMEREYGRHGDRLQHLDEVGHGGGLGVRLPVHGDDRVAGCGDAEALQHVRVRRRNRSKDAGGVDHHVPDQVDALMDALTGQVGDRRRAGAEADVGEDVGHNAVQLLRHRAVVGAQAGLDVGQAKARLGRGQGPRERRVRVAVDDGQVGRLRFQQRLEGGHHGGRLARVTAPADALDAVVGRRQPELVEEDLGEVLVIVLAGVHQQVAGTLGDGRGDRCSLHELRPVADDGDDLHPGQPTGQGGR